MVDKSKSSKLDSNVSQKTSAVGLEYKFVAILAVALMILGFVAGFFIARGPVNDTSSLIAKQNAQISQLQESQRASDEALDFLQKNVARTKPTLLEEGKPSSDKISIEADSEGKFHSEYKISGIKLGYDSEFPLAENMINVKFNANGASTPMCSDDDSDDCKKETKLGQVQSFYSTALASACSYTVINFETFQIDEPFVSFDLNIDCDGVLPEKSDSPVSVTMPFSFSQKIEDTSKFIFSSDPILFEVK
jgi:hypothetical protein